MWREVGLTVVECNTLVEAVSPAREQPLRDTMGMTSKARPELEVQKRYSTF